MPTPTTRTVRSAAAFILAAAVLALAAAIPPALTAQDLSAGAGSNVVAPRDGAGGDYFSAWGVLLSRYVDSRGLVDYMDWKMHDQGTLERIVAALDRATPDQFRRDEDKLAFWINSYNACVVLGILQRYPIQSVQTAGGFFTDATWKIAGLKLSLDDIENKKIRPVFKEPRVHFALVCGAKSCPRLLAKAYTGNALALLLDNQARNFLSDPTKNTFDAVTGHAQVSSLFRWYASDFTTGGTSLIDYLKKYAPPSAQPVLARPDLQLEFLPYDWSLNERPAAGSGAGGHARD